MTFRIRIQNTALMELDSVIAFLDARDSKSASRFFEAFQELLTRLKDGLVEYRLSRFGTLARLGYHTALVGDYVVLYFRRDEEVVVAHLFHQSQDYETLLIHAEEE